MKGQLEKIYGCQLCDMLSVGEVFAPTVDGKCDRCGFDGGDASVEMARKAAGLPAEASAMRVAATALVRLVSFRVKMHFLERWFWSRFGL